jgi:hypothetical protein
MIRPLLALLLVAGFAKTSAEAATPNLSCVYSATEVEVRQRIGARSSDGAPETGAAEDAAYLSQIADACAREYRWSAEQRQAALDYATTRFTREAQPERQATP